MSSMEPDEGKQPEEEQPGQPKGPRWDDKDDPDAASAEGPRWDKDDK